MTPKADLQMLQLHNCSTKSCNGLVARGVGIFYYPGKDPFQQSSECPRLARSRLRACTEQHPLSGVKRISSRLREMSACDPKRTSAGAGDGGYFSGNSNESSARNCQFGAPVG